MQGGVGEFHMYFRVVQGYIERCRIDQKGDPLLERNACGKTILVSSIVQTNALLIVIALESTNNNDPFPYSPDLGPVELSGRNRNSMVALGH